jgi:hypothetical protein
LIQENPSEAQALVEEILGLMESHTLEGTEEPIRVYLTCYRVLMANQDPRAKELLNTAFRLVEERAASTWKMCLLTARSCRSLRRNEAQPPASILPSDAEDVIEIFGIVLKLNHEFSKESK